MMHDPIDIAMKHHGGFINHKPEKGGPTKFGVSQKTYSQYLGRGASLQEVKDMTEDAAREIYERAYLTGPRISLLQKPLRIVMLDMAIQHGPMTANKMLQRVLNQAGFGPITLDGVLGPRTRDAVSKAQREMGKVLQNALVEERLKYLHKKVVENPDDRIYLDGWIARANSFKLK